VGNTFTKYIGFVWHQVSLCVKILVVAVVLLVLVQTFELISLDINVNSGGLETTSGEVYFWCFYGLMAFLFLFLILIPACFIVSLIKISEPINILVTFIAVVIAVASFGGRAYLLNEKIKCKPEPDSMRCVAHNTARGKILNEFGLKLVQLKNDKNFALSEKFIGQNLTSNMLPLINSEFVLNSNVLNKELSQLPDNIVVVFESNVPSRDEVYTGGPDDISTWWHYGRGSLMVFGDGRVEFVKTEDFNNLRWKP